MYAARGVSLVNNTITANLTNGVEAESADLHGDSITGNGGNGILVTGAVTIDSSLIGGNAGRGVVAESNPQITDSNIVGNGDYAASTTAGISAKNVWWGTADPARVRAQLLNDPTEPSLIVDQPFATAPVAGAPPPPQGGFPIPSLAASNMGLNTPQASPGDVLTYTLDLV